MGKIKRIRCPICKGFLVDTHLDEFAIHEIACSRCHKLIKYNPYNSNDFIAEEIPAKSDSGGRRFY